MKKLNKEDICFMSAYDMREKIVSQELSSLEITETIIERIEKINPLINAYCTTTFDLARDVAKKADIAIKKGEKPGVLHGIPCSIKDLMETKGIRTTFGSLIYEKYVPEENDIDVQRLLDAGCVMLGKTNTPEFGHMPRTFNFIFGNTKNPWDLERSCGGSSGGAAAAVAAGLGPLALGSDGGGSIRCPSAFCGCFGLKPSFGRVPINPRNLSFSTLSHHGPITNHVKDAALMLDALAGSHFIDKYSFLQKDTKSYREALEEEKIPTKLKIGYMLNLGRAKVRDKEGENSFLNAIHKFEQFEWSVEEVKLKIKNVQAAYGPILTSTTLYDFKDHLEEWGEKIHPGILSRIHLGRNIKGVEIAKANSYRQGIEKVIYQYFRNHDILITPTSPIPAFGLERKNSQKEELNSIINSMPFNLSWNPAASIPCGWFSDGLPMGMQIIGKKLDEKTVLQVSKAFEEVNPWQDKKPIFN